MKRSKQLKDFKEMSADSLREKALSIEHELMNLRFKHRAGQLQNTTQLRTIRRSIARAKTVLNENSQDLKTRDS
jgi:large subunit ribosomal protein L29